MKRTSIVKLPPPALASLSTAAMTLASAEGLDGHRRSIAIRLKVER
jgi:histidinol dehydrogenase